MPLSPVPRPPLRLLRPSPRPAGALACCPVCNPQPVAETAVGQAFATFLRLEVAQGAASPETQRGYWSQVRAWAAWCQAQACCLATAPATAVKTYRQALVESGYQPASIAHKLAVLRRFYAAAIAQGLRADNPALGVHPPRERRAVELLPYLAEGELVSLLQAVPHADTGDRNTARRRRLRGVPRRRPAALSVIGISPPRGGGGTTTASGLRDGAEERPHPHPRVSALVTVRVVYHECRCHGLGGDGGRDGLSDSVANRIDV
jgi:hypothetical protein